MTTIKISNTNIHALLLGSIGACGCTETLTPEADTEARSLQAEPEAAGMGGRRNGPRPQRMPPRDEEGCHGIYAQDLLPTFELTIDEDVWDMIAWEWKHGAKQEKKGADPHPYHPLAEFRYRNIVITTAEIRLRGNPDYWFDDPNKWQFQIEFDNVDKNGHFMGLEVLVFDAATYNRHMLRDRLGLSIMRDMGIIAPCANHARLDINGEYYGLFTNIEKIDDKFLERAFDDPSGDLWKRQNWEIKNNKKTANKARLDALRQAETIEELEMVLDVEQALRVYAAEAILPDSDGGWAGGLNFYVYDDPTSGVFKLLPWDLDNVFERFNDGKKGDYPNNPDPVVWEKPGSRGRPWYEIALDDDDYFWYYIEAIRTQFEAGYDVATLHQRIHTWTEQIQDSVLEDVNKPFSNEKYFEDVAELQQFIQARADFLEEWLQCWEDGGEPDKKGYCDD